MSERRTSGKLRGFLLLLLLGTLVLLGLAAFRAGPPPKIEIDAKPSGIGKRTPVRVVVREPRRGLGELRVELHQGDLVHELAARSHQPLEPWQLWGPRQREEELALEIGSETVQGLREGSIVLRVVAERAGAWLRRPAPATSEVTLPVKLRPPALSVLSTFTYVTQGGAEAVVYQVGPTAVADGVQAGDWWFPGQPLPGNRRFALFAAPYDLDQPERIRLVARDDVGNEARAAFIDRFTERPIRVDRIQLSDAFLEKVVPSIMAQSPEVQDRGSLLDNYLAINGELRRANNATLAQLAQSSERAFLWQRPFLQMRNAQVMSDFADRRIYVFDGREVDRQDHLGFDLASVRQAEIQAGNDGVVKLARYFGIYGNTVVIDHGYGLMSLYGHLSSIGVAEGDRVTRGQTVGRSGETGLAGGDHLHFTMLLYGLPIDPREWWDDHWIRDRLELKLGDALPFSG
jgi:murein DD-endopeptidase MepM/ murein hydrolase activator NlpD